MYLAVVVLLMGLLPAAAIVMDLGQAPLPVLIGKWFVFWAVGVRLLTAGLRQVLQPRFTAEDILGVTDPAAVPLVRELGFANIAMGGLGVLSLAIPAWALPAAIPGGLFLALAGIGHLRKRDRNRKETIAMVSDLFAATVLAGFVVATVMGR